MSKVSVKLGIVFLLYHNFGRSIKKMHVTTFNYVHVYVDANMVLGLFYETLGTAVFMLHQ
jgi:hypothetical protein